MPVTILHVADPHVDSPLVGLSRYPGAPDVTLATRRAFSAAVDLAIAERVDLVLIAGDLYDGDWKDFHTGLFVAAELSRLREAGVPVVLVAGNHDAASVLTKSLRLPPGVRRLGHARPETAVFDDVGVAVHGQSFARRAVTDDLSAAYPAPLAGLFNVGLLHTSADGRPGHDTYAPCRLDGLRARGYDLWALGHVHQREVLCEAPWIVFPGNLQGRHVRETGPKGATLVRFDGHEATIEHRTLDVLRWARLELDATDAQGTDDVLRLAEPALTAALDAADGRPLAVRVEVAGATAAHGALADAEEALLNDLRSLATDAGAGQAWVERLRLRTRRPPTGAALREQRETAGEVLRAVRAAAGDGELRAALVDALAPLHARLPRELKEGDDALRLDEPDRLAALLGEVEELVLAKLALEAA